MDSDSPRVAELLVRLKQGDKEALAELFSIYRDWLRRIVDLRLDPRLCGRISGSDVLQDAYLDAEQRLPHFLKSEMPFHLWLRWVMCQRLVDVHRCHLAQMRDAGREITLNGGAMPQASSVTLVRHFAGTVDSPSEAAIKREEAAALEAALEQMDPLDREVLTLRHFEELSNEEVAQVLGLQESAASNRYVRALKRLRDALARPHRGGQS